MFGLFGAEVLDEARDDFPGFVCLLVDVAELILVDVALVHGYVQMALNLRSRRHGNEEELGKLSARSPDKAFGDVCHDGTSSGLDLARQPKVSFEGRTFRSRIYHVGKLPGLLPAFKVFETGEFHDGWSGLSRSSGLSG